MNETLFLDLSKIIEDQSSVKKEISPDHWGTIDYEIEERFGKMLFVGEETEPPKISLVPNVTGWQRIYICTVKMDFNNKFNIKLSSDKAFSSVFPPKENPPVKWAPHEYSQEFFWKCADMTSQKIEIRKPKTYNPCGVAIAWLRFESMTESEIEELKEYRNSPKNAHYHFDGNEHTMEELNSPNDALTRLSVLKNSDADICSMEFVSDYGVTDRTNGTMYSLSSKAFATGDKKFRANKQAYYKEKIDFLHNINVKALAAYRMSVTSFGVDSYGRMELEFAETHPEYYCKTRDGRTVSICSYAYPEVHDYVINGFKDVLQHGFDGISLILHRGIMINFEEPVIKRFKEKYPDLDPRTLPIKDDRLNGIWCEFMTKFMRKLRKETTESKGHPIIINILTDFDPDTAKHIGLDIESWAKEGLIDSVCQDTMEAYEEIEDCLNEDGLINLDKYTQKIKKTETVRRFFGYNIEKIVCGAKKYKNIADRYNIKFYGGIYSWPANTDMILENHRKLKELGINNFSVYNFVHLSVTQPFYHTLANICHDKIDERYIRPSNHRVMSLGGLDISTFNPNWRG